jgi:hypothetical protein
MRRNAVVGIVMGVSLGAVAAGCGGSSSSSSSTPSCSGATPVALTVMNYLSWCSVSVAGQAATSNSSQTTCVAAGPVSVTATALSGFELGPAPWHDTEGDSGAGDPGTVTGSGQSAMSMATVNTSGTSSCAWVCCPFSPGGNGCPTTNLCP